MNKIMTPKSMSNPGSADCSGTGNPFRINKPVFMEYQTQRNLELMEKTQARRNAKGGRIDFVQR